MNAVLNTPRVNIIRRVVPCLETALHSNPLAHRLLAARGVTDTAELDFALADLPRPGSLPDIDKAVARLLQARRRKESILVVGDYDCDGATSTAVALLGLSMLGFTDVEFLIPCRFRFGYGLSPAVVKMAFEKHQPSLILTVDNGVASVEGVDCAREQGVDVLVTDHHLAPQSLPAAIAIVNPTMPGSRFPDAHLAGVGVIFYTLLALRSQLAKDNDTHAKAPLAELLDLVAIGTVADVVPLSRCNRTLVEQGLRRIRSGRTRPGVLALLQVADISHDSLSTQGIGFGLGPRLNAAGRLDDMSIGVRCLLAEEASVALSLATQLNDLNSERRAIETQMKASAEEQLRSQNVSTLQQSGRFSVCLKDDSWHEGVIGILAGRIKEAVYRPCIVFTSDGDNTLKGSARSIPGVHIRDVLQTIASEHPGMVEKFGGHAMAAGLTLSRDRFDEFCELFEAGVCHAMNGQPAAREWVIDGSLTDTERTIENARLLVHLMPWGQQFEAPLFADEFIVRSQRSLSNGRHQKLVVQGRDSVACCEAIAFNCESHVQKGDCVYIVYSLDVNAWRDREQLQLRVHYLEASGLR